MVPKAVWDPKGHRLQTPNNKLTVNLSVKMQKYYAQQAQTVSQWLVTPVWSATIQRREYLFYACDGCKPALHIPVSSVKVILERTARHNVPNSSRRGTKLLGEEEGSSRLSMCPYV